MFVLRAASATACTAVNGGATTISTPPTSFTALRSSFTNTTASATVLYIFQLPAMTGILIGHADRAGRAGQTGRARSCSFVRQRRNAGQRAAAEKFERCAAAGRNVRHPVG